MLTKLTPPSVSKDQCKGMDSVKREGINLNARLKTTQGERRIERSELSAKNISGLPLFFPRKFGSARD